MRLSFLREQLVRNSEQLVLVNTKKGFNCPGDKDIAGNKDKNYSKISTMFSLPFRWLLRVDEAG